MNIRNYVLRGNGGLGKLFGIIWRVRILLVFLGELLALIALLYLVLDACVHVLVLV